MNASIHDVAKRAGVSISTVSRVINHSAGVKESKVKAVREALEYYDYEPSQFGRGLATGSSKLIGVYSPFSDGGMFQSGYILECLRGIDKVIKESPYSLLLITERTSYDQSENAKPKFMEYVNQKKIDGLIVLSIPSDGRLEGALSAIMEQDFPIGYIGKKFHEKGVNVYAKYEEYMLDAIRRMYEKGHRRIAFLPLKTRSITNNKIKSKAEASLEGLHVCIADMNSDIEGEFIADIIRYMVEERKVTGIITETLSIVMKIQSIISTAGKSIGTDISVISIEHTYGEGAHMLPKIDCFYVPAVEIGEAIAMEMIDWLENRKDRETEKIFSPEYQDRGSVVSVNLQKKK